MNFKNSSSTVSPKQSLSSNNLLKPVSFSTRYKLPILIILSIVIFLLGIFIFVFIAKYIQKKKKKIRRQNVIIKKHCESNLDNLEDVTLIEQNYDGTIGSICVISTDPVIKPKIIDTSSHTPRGSTTISVSSINISTANPSNETNHTDELFGLDFTKIPLPRLKLSNSDLTDPTLPEVINHPSHDSSQNQYVTAFKEQEKEEANARKQSINIEKLTSSVSSEESCL